MKIKLKIMSQITYYFHPTTFKFKERESPPTRPHKTGNRAPTTPETGITVTYAACFIPAYRKAAPDIPKSPARPPRCYWANPIYPMMPALRKP